MVGALRFMTLDLSLNPFVRPPAIVHCSNLQHLFFFVATHVCVGCKTHNIAFRLVSQQCCETSWTVLFLVLP